MTKLDMEGTRKTISKGGYLPYPNYGNKYLNSFFPYMSRLWNNLPNSTKCKNLSEFKIQLNCDMKPSKIKHNSKGTKIGNYLLSRLRIGRSDLNLHRFTIGLSDSPECYCHSKEESTKHYILDCFLYAVERQTLFSLAEHFIPTFTKLSKTKQFEIRMYGLKTDDPLYNYLNTKITFAVQKFILKTKRF